MWRENTVLFEVVSILIGNDAFLTALATSFTFAPKDVDDGF